MTVGAGTVVTPSQVDLAVAAGAQFIVTPGFSRAVIDRCIELGCPVIPGVATASDIMAAFDARLRILKFFPAEPLGGLRTLNALAGPFPQARFVPTGGLTLESVPRYLSTPRCGPLAAAGWSRLTSCSPPTGSRSRGFVEKQSPHRPSTAWVLPLNSNFRPVWTRDTPLASTRTALIKSEAPMTYVYNDPAEFKNDVLRGFAAAYPQYVQPGDGCVGVRPRRRAAGGQGQPGHRRRFGPLPVLQRRRGHRVRRRRRAR